MMKQESAVQARPPTPWGWMLIALAAQTGWGAYPVLARYLQTISDLPSMSLLAVGNLLALAIVAVTLLPRIDRRVFRLRILWLLAVVVVVRAITNLLAARYTLAIYVQLITQMTPFVVALLSATLLRESLPRYTGRAITLCLLGTLLIMRQDIGLAGAFSGGRHDWLGLGLALASSLALAVYMILVRRTIRHAMPGEAVLVVHLVALSLVCSLLSLLLGEPWGQWRQLGLWDWLIFLAFSLGVLLGSNLGQIGSLRHLGAPLVSSLLAWRLLSTLLVAAVLLHERLTSPWQAAGAIVVLVTITWYLRQQS